MPESNLPGYPYVYNWQNPESEYFPDFVQVMDIRLIYKGPLLATGNDPLKADAPKRLRDIQRIRRVIHGQLAVLWDKHPVLKTKSYGRFIWSADLRRKLALYVDGIDYRNSKFPELLRRGGETEDPIWDEGYSESEALGKRFNKCGFSFVPLVNDYFDTVCGLDILFLRREDPGDLITNLSGGDIDNRLKTLFDALQIPDSCTQIDGVPAPDETPFYTLLQNDGLITDVKVTTDRLLQPLEPGEKQNEVVLIIQVHIKTSQAWFDSADSGFEESDTEVLDQ